MNDPTFDAAALAEFRRVFGDQATDDFRATIAEAGPMALMLLCERLKLSENDRNIFYGAGRALKRDVQPA